MAFIEVNDLSFDEILSEEFSKNNIVILKFSSEYCDACMALGFELEEIDDSHDNVSILEIDCSESEYLTQRYEIIEVPTMIIYKNKDTIIWNNTGVVMAQDIENIMK